MDNYTYSFYAKVSERRLYFSKPNGVFAWLVKRLASFIDKNYMKDHFTWVRKSMTVSGNVSDREEMLRILQDTRHPLWFLVHGNYDIVNLGGALGIGEGDKKVFHPQIEYGNVANPFNVEIKKQ